MHLECPILLTNIFSLDQLGQEVYLVSCYDTKYFDGCADRAHDQTTASKTIWARLLKASLA